MILYSISEATSTVVFLCTGHMVESSRNVPVVVFRIIGRSEMCNTYKTGSRTLPCATPYSIGKSGV